MTGNVDIVRIGRDRRDRLESLAVVFADAFEDPDTYLSRPAGAAHLDRLLGSDTFIALAAMSGNDVIGGLVAYELVKFEQARSEIYIYDLAVAEDHRRRGVARSLINHLKGIARERGAWVIYVQADYGDEPAIALYESMGAREDVMHFDIDIR